MANPEYDAIVRRFYREVVEAGRPEAAEALLSNRDPASDVGAVIRRIAEIHAAIPDLAVEVDSLAIEGSEVRVQAVVRGTHAGDLAGMAATGEPIEIAVSDEFHIAEGRIASYESHVATAGILQYSPLPGYSDVDPPRKDDEDDATTADEDVNPASGFPDVDSSELEADADYSELPGDPDVDPPTPDDEDMGM